MKLILWIILLLNFPVQLSCQQTTIPKRGTTTPFVLGITEEIYSTILGENRIINIYLPDGYTTSDSLKYPVIYLLDGSADEDFIHVVGLVQFQTFDWIQQIPKSIVVGIGSVDRERDFTFPTKDTMQQRRFQRSGHSSNFISFIEKELQPYIETYYNASRDNTLIGQSLGGLLATEILLTKPHLFNRYIIISPSLWWDNASLLQKEMFTTSKTNIYIGIGKEGLVPSEMSSIPHVMEVDASLLAEKIQHLNNPNFNVWLDYLPEENHATILHQAVFNAFRCIYPKKKED